MLLHAWHIVSNSFKISFVHVSLFAVGTCSHSTKKIYCHGRIRLGLELILVRFKPCFLNTDNASANAPGSECSIVKDISDFLFFFCLSVSPAAAVLRKLVMLEERSANLFLKTKKRVVLSARSSMCSCNTYALWNSAASLLAIAASWPEVSFATISTAFEVEETSCRSIPRKCWPRNFSHWPHAWGCVYSLFIDLKESSLLSLDGRAPIIRQCCTVRK